MAKIKGMLDARKLTNNSCWECPFFDDNGGREPQYHSCSRGYDIEDYRPVDCVARLGNYIGIIKLSKEEASEMLREKEKREKEEIAKEEIERLKEEKRELNNKLSKILQEKAEVETGIEGEKRKITACSIKPKGKTRKTWDANLYL